MLKKIFIGIMFCIIGFGCYTYLSKPKISVVMSTYNRASFLPRSIESILNQTFTDFEFIIINDGSPDNSAEILKKYAKQDSRIRVITNKQNKGLIYSLNKGLDEAKGKYIARMDDDDIALPNRFEKQYAFMEKNKDFAAVGSWVANPDDNKKWAFHSETSPEKIKVLLYLNKVPISHPASFLRRSFLNKHHIRYSYKYKAAEDRKFWLDIIDAGGKITNIPEVLLLFRLHASNPEQYYIDQRNNANQFFHDEILSRFGKNTDFDSLNRCKNLKKMAVQNKKIKLISQSLLDLFIKDECPLDDNNEVVHPLWAGYFSFNGNRVCRYKHPDCATIVNQTSNVMTIKWDAWGEETFENKEGVWFFKQ